MESEYMSLSDATREAIARHQFFRDLHILVNNPIPHSDNQAALSESRTISTFAIWYPFYRQAVQNDQVTLDYVPTDKQSVKSLAFNQIYLLFI
jgi:hypothetical protein